MTQTPRSAGHTLAEMLIAMTVMAVVGSAITRLIVIQSRAFARQDAGKQARSVTRAALNVMQSELRMVEVTGGVVAASATSITVRVPYAMGIVCSPSTISMLPVDSLMYAQANFSGYAWRDDAGNYTYVEASPTVSAGTTANCTGQSITTLAGGLVVNVGPAMPVGATVGNNVFLYSKIKYSFGPSTLISGRYGLFRTPLATNVAEEMSAPFDSTGTRFRFYNLNADSAQSAVPALANIRGVAIDLKGQSERVPRNSTSYISSTITTAIFFGNRVN